MRTRTLTRQVGHEDNLTAFMKARTKLHTVSGYPAEVFVSVCVLVCVRARVRACANPACLMLNNPPSPSQLTLTLTIDT